MIGLESDKVLLAEYDSEWISYYESESKAIKNALGDLAIDIQHIGSTSVTGLKAKPIIDILVGLESFDRIGEVIRIMENLGYTYAHWAGIPGDYTFRKGDITTHLIHIVRYGRENWNHNIGFRDILRRDPDVRKRYERLKEELAELYPDSREKYTEGKSKFIFDIHRKITEGSPRAGVIERIHIVGASGSGTTTLGEALAQKLGYEHFDTDYYFWIPSHPPFQAIREREDRIRLLRTDLDHARKWILSGSLCGRGDVFITDFDLVIYLWIPHEIRMKRLLDREKQRYGAPAIEEGGIMHQASRDFIEWASKYDDGDVNIRSKALHEQWLSRLKCKLIRLEGDLTVDERVERVIKNMNES